MSVCNTSINHAHGSQAIREPYKNWAEGHIEKIRGILNASRTAHTDAVKQRIDSVEQMKDVVAITEGLFAISKVCPTTRFLPHVAKKTS